MSEYLNDVEAAKFLRLEVATLHRKFSKGQIEGVKRGRVWFTTWTWIEDYILGTKQRYEFESVIDIRRDKTNAARN